MPNDEQVHLAAEGFRLLADPTRIKILWALLQGESSVACLAELVGAAPTAVSQHLAKLRLAGLVRGRREGTLVHYSAADPPYGHCWPKPCFTPITPTATCPTTPPVTGDPTPTCPHPTCARPRTPPARGPGRGRAVITSGGFGWTASGPGPAPGRGPSGLRRIGAVSLGQRVRAMRAMPDVPPS